MDRPDWIITPKELVSETGQVVLVDVREPEEWEEGRLESAIHIPLGELQRRAETELSPASDLVIYCAHGIRSLQAVSILRMLGFDRTRSLDGGIGEWEELGLPVVR